MAGHTVAPHQKGMHMLCSWWICPVYCFLLHYCEASHLDLRNYTFFEYFRRECEASHSK